MKNYDDVLDQILNYGLRPVIPLTVGNIVRTKVDGHRGTKGWYVLHSMPVSGGDLLVGSYGIWHGIDDNRQKIFIKIGDELSAEQKKAFAKRMADDRKRNEAFKKKRAETAARKAASAWDKACEQGDHEYLTRKNIQALGVRFTDKGALMIPMQDTSGKIHGVQLILDRVKHKEQLKNNGRDKLYWPPGVNKKGHFHLIGSPVNILLIAEGYATASSLRMATGLPVAVAFDANNLMPVAEALKKRYKNIQIIVCADDDAFSKCIECNEPVNVNQSVDCPHCNKPHKKKNTGVEAASMVAMTLICHWVKPEFSDPAAIYERFCKGKGKLTDFNDLHLTDGLQLVRVKIDNAIDQLKLRGKLTDAGKPKQGGGEDDALIIPFSRSDELLERFALIYGAGGTVFDHDEHKRLPLSDMRDACQRRDVHRDWQESPTRQIVREEDVVFDPAEEEGKPCNLWSGWPTEPKKGDCSHLLELLEYMCNEKDGGDQLNTWVLKWLAYPIQNPGAKMRTTVVVHGAQGTGKNLFFEAVMSIYGSYGRIIDQSAIEDKFNDWASKKLFLIANEVVARTDLYHVKNKLKSFITEDWIRINPKNMGAYEERNHVNLVFLSNERMPVVLEKDDRRHTVIWTPEKLSDSFYHDVSVESKNGGISALHDHLLNLPLGDFNEHTKPLMTQAKIDLIELGKDSILRFYEEWINGELDGFRLLPVIGSDLYELYKIWCGQNGVRSAPLHKMIDAISKQHGVQKKRPPYQDGMKQKQKRFLFPPQHIEHAPGESQVIWLGECVSEFREAFEAYKNADYV